MEFGDSVGFVVAVYRVAVAAVGLGVAVGEDGGVVEVFLDLQEGFLSFWWHRSDTEGERDEKEEEESENGWKGICLRVSNNGNLNLRSWILW